MTCATFQYSTRSHLRGEKPEVYSFTLHLKAFIAFLEGTISPACLTFEPFNIRETSTYLTWSPDPSYQYVTLHYKVQLYLNVLQVLLFEFLLLSTEGPILMNNSQIRSWFCHWSLGPGTLELTKKIGLPLVHMKNYLSNL